MAGKRKLEVIIAGDAKGLAGAVKSGNSSLGSFGKAVGKVALGVGAAAAAAVAGLTAIGGTFDDATDTIRVGTGATGAALEGLQADFKSVVSDVPTDFGRAATAIADLNTRTGQTGEGLQDLAKRSLELSRITGTDIGEVVSTTTRLFGDWSIATGDQAETLDKLFRASQSTGIGVDKLADTVVSFGAPLRQMGFSFEESIAMLGKWEKEGVNTEAILGGLKQALGKMAKAGKEPVAEFKRLSEAIANAGSAGEANSIAVEAFGSRAGPDLAAAIREGRFELSDYLDAVNNGSDTIMQAAEDTKDWRESLQEFKNKALVLIEPVATRVFGAVSNAMDVLGPQLMALGEEWGPKVFAAFDEIGRVVQTYVVPAFHEISGWWDTNGPTVIAGATAVKDGIVAAFTAVVAAVTWVVDHWATIEPIIIGTAAVIATVMIPHWIALRVQATISAAKQVAAWVTTQVGAMKAAVVHSGQVVAMVAKWVFLGVKATFHAAVVVAGWIATGAAAIAQGVVHAAQVGLMVAKWVFLGAQSLLHAGKVAAAWLIAMGPIGLVIAAVVGLVALIVANWDTIVRVTRELWEKVTTFFSNLSSSVSEKVSGLVDSVTTWFRELPGRILAALGNLGGLLVNAGRSILDGLWRGLREKWESVKDWVGGLGNKIKGLKGPIRKDRKLLLDEGDAIMHSLAVGLRSGFPDVKRALRDATDLIALQGDRDGSIIGRIGGDQAQMTRGRTGPAVHIENAHFADEVDVDMLMRRAAFAAGGPLG